ncbi:MAG: glycogen debranching protein, partial [Jiangellaceae bacterium]
LADSISVQGKHLLFRDEGKPQSPNFESHDWAAAFGSDLSPNASKVGKNFRGPQDPAVICPASGPSAPPQPERCDDTEYGKGVGGQLAYKVKLQAGQVKTVRFGVGGSAAGPAQARAELRKSLDNPEAAIRGVVRHREGLDARSDVSLPGNPLLAQSVAWSKQILAASEQRVEDLELRAVNAGQAYPPPAGTLRSMRWLGAGWPDYTWLFGTDGEYTAFAAVAAGQFEQIKDHLRALRDVSEIVNEGSGKIVHEVTPDGAVFFGANADAGNTDESSKYPSAVALVWRWTGDERFLKDLYPASVKAMKYVAGLDEDGDGWPEGLGNVERTGMGEEKLDNAAYTIRGYADLADLAQAVGDGQTRRWATNKAKALLDKFENDWWYDADGARSYADSRDDPDNKKVFQRHWIGLTPTDAVLPSLPGRRSAPLASDEHANTTLDQHEKNCFTGELGLFHTGTGPTSAPAGNPGPSCDSVVSAVPSERSIFTLNSAIAAVSEGNFGRISDAQQGVYMMGNARSQLDPSLWEMPGAMPEIVPSPDFVANINRLFTERSMVLQAWGAYGVLWPVIHQWLGVSPDLGRGRVSVVPQLPESETKASVNTVRLGLIAIDVAAERQDSTYTTTVTRHGRVDLRIGAVLPDGATVTSATLNGSLVKPKLVQTTRGLEAVISAQPEQRTATLVINIDN